MTESEWNSCADPQKMLGFLRGKVSDRKFRLFGTACWRMHGFVHDTSRAIAVNAAQQFADGEITKAEFDKAWGRTTGENALAWAIDAAKWAAWAIAGGKEVRSGPMKEQSSLMRDIFGNTFKPVTMNRTWVTSTVVSLAQAIYDDRAFDRMGILADALEEAGCTSTEMLEHCRGGKEHVRGCWVVDLVLRKE